MFIRSKSIPFSSSVKIFLRGLFDDAGLFPPASLTMRRALLNYANHQSEADNWMTGPFVCPVARLEELVGEKDLFEKAAPIRLSLLPGFTPNSGAFEPSFIQDVVTVERLRIAHPKTFDVTMMEIRVPPHIVAKNEDEENESSECLSFDQWLQIVFAELEKMASPPLRIFLEVPREDNYVSALETAIQSISRVQSSNTSAGLKIRCGGVHENDYPSSMEIAQFLKTVISGGQFFKATAGLHHPVRHFNTDADVEMHGFLNVFFAAFFCAELELDITELTSIIDATDPSLFEFVDDGIRFKNYFIPSDTLRELRSNQILSIGSCSFDEPREDLHALSWLVGG